MHKFKKVFDAGEYYMFRVEVKQVDEVLKAECIFERKGVTEDVITMEEMDTLYASIAKTQGFFNMINSWCKETSHSGITDRVIEKLKEEFDE